MGRPWEQTQNKSWKGWKKMLRRHQVDSAQPDKSPNTGGVEERTGGNNLFCRGTESRGDLFSGGFFFFMSMASNSVFPKVLSLSSILVMF